MWMERQPERMEIGHVVVWSQALLVCAQHGVRAVGAPGGREVAVPGRSPAGDGPIQLTGYTWRSGGLELLWRPWPRQDPSAVPAAAGALEPERWPILRGTTVAIAAARPGVPGERRCIGYHPPEGGPLRLCPEWRAVAPGGRAQCEECARREGRLEVVASDGSRPPTGPLAGYLRSAHEVYVAAFAPAVIKIGVAGAGRTALRVLEQGAPAGLVIGRAADGMAARRLEHALGQVGLRERVPASIKLRLLYPPPETAALQAGLAAALGQAVAALPGGWPDEVERLDPPRPLDNTPILGLDALDAAPQPAPGPPAGGIRGQVAAAAGALLVVRPAQATLWGEAAPLAAASHDLRTWLGWRVETGVA
jgi:hypothetical protein